MTKGGQWDTSQLYSSGVLSVVAAGIPGDYNQNGVVGEADFVLWRKTIGTNNALANDLIGGTIGTAHYDQWRSHFGQTSGSGAGTVVNDAVPELSTLATDVFGACLLSKARPNRAKKFHQLINA